jgi:hypothetical protein
MTSTTTTSTAGQTAGAAKDQAAQVAGTATSAATEVAGTAKEQAANVVGEALSQTHDLLGQAGEQLNAQATEQTQRLSGNIRQLADHFSTMAGAGESGTPARSLVEQASQHAERVAGYLDGKAPGELVADLQNLGRRRPGTFLLGAAIAGVAVGRLASAARKNQPSGIESSGIQAQPPLAVTPPVANPVPPVRNVTPGAATVEPYPDPTVTPPTTPPAGSW